jgi:hypothetical protein
VERTELLKIDGARATDFSWTCPDEGSSWEKFHQFYIKSCLFNSKQIDVSAQKIKFGALIYISELYHNKYKVLGIEVVPKEGKKSGMGKIVFKRHVKSNK